MSTIPEPDHNRNRKSVRLYQCHQSGPVNLFQSKVNVNSVVVNHAHIVQGQPQRKGVSPAIIRRQSLKYVNNISCVDQLFSNKLASDVPNVEENMPVGARLNQFWETWEALGAGPKVVQMLKEGYTLPFLTRPNLTRSPTIIICYVHPHRNIHLLETLGQLTNKNAVELVKNQESQQQPAIFGTKTKQMETYTRSEQSKKIPQDRKMETPEMIRTSLQTGECVISIDFKEAYFHIPI